MTNSSPQPPENESNDRPILDFDEKVAVIVAFLVIGLILFWSLGSGLRTGVLSTSRLKSSFSGWKDSLLSSTKTKETPNIFSTEAKVKIIDNVALNSEFGKTLQLDTVEETSKDLDRQSRIKARDDLDDATAFTEPARSTFGLAAPVAGGLALDRKNAISPEVSPKTPERETETPTPAEVPSETPEREIETSTPEVTQLAFTDVKPDYWAYPFIEQLEAQKLISGFSGNNLFEPNKLITRASMATLISQAFERPASQPAKNFTDVSNQNALVADIKKAVETGFMKGYSDREFRPLVNIPRYQVLVALATGLGLKPSQNANDILSKFDDTDTIPDWAKEQVAAATEAGLAVNRPEFSNNTLKPEEPATRAEVAAMIHQALVRLDQLESIDSQYIVQP